MGVERPELPEEYAAALGSSRVRHIERRAEDLAAHHAAWPPNGKEEREELSKRARALGPALRELDVEVGRRVVALEAHREDLRERWIDAGRELDDLSGDLGFSEPTDRERLRIDMLRGDVEVARHGLRSAFASDALRLGLTMGLSAGDRSDRNLVAGGVDEDVSQSAALRDHSSRGRSRRPRDHREPGSRLRTRAAIEERDSEPGSARTAEVQCVRGHQHELGGLDA